METSNCKSQGALSGVSGTAVRRWSLFAEDKIGALLDRVHWRIDGALDFRRSESKFVVVDATVWPCINSQWNWWMDEQEWSHSKLKAPTILPKCSSQLTDSTSIFSADVSTLPDDHPTTMPTAVLDKLKSASKVWIMNAWLDFCELNAYFLVSGYCLWIAKCSKHASVSQRYALDLGSSRRDEAVRCSKRLSWWVGCWRHVDGICDVLLSFHR